MLESFYINSMKKAHFIGICGAGMSAVANLLIEKGWAVSGSDEGFYPPISTYLQKQNIPCLVGYRKENIPPDIDIIVIGKHAKLVPEENEEVREAQRYSEKIKSFPEVLALLTNETENILAVGSFGKSTNTSLLSWILQFNGKDPSFFIGAIPKTPETSSHIGKGEQFIIEGDEYPSANWDSRSKFLFYKPHDILLTSLAHDHINVFPTVSSYIAPYRRLLQQLPDDGLLVACLDGEGVPEFIQETNKKVVTYALQNKAEWSAQNIIWGEETIFNLVKNGEMVTPIRTSLLGTHNIENIVGVSALLLSKNLVTTEELARAISKFKSITRRLDRKSEQTTIPIYEGFGSSYEKAKSAIAAIKLHFPERRLLIVFEPHTFSWRNRGAIEWYDTIFTPAEKVFIYKPPTHGADTHEQLTLTEIIDRVRNTGKDVTGFEHASEGQVTIMNSVEKNDVVLLLTSGDLGGLIETLPKASEKNFPRKD